MHGFPFGGHPVTALASIKATHRSDSVVIDERLSVRLNLMNIDISWPN
jgi:hypothetical protein